MNDPTTQTDLDEQVWREWAHKGKLREQYRTRRRQKVGSILAVLSAIAFVIFYLSTTT